MERKNGYVLIMVTCLGLEVAGARRLQLNFLHRHSTPRGRSCPDLKGRPSFRNAVYGFHLWRTSVLVTMVVADAPCSIGRHSFRGLR